jgi:hypothetical protein
MDKPVVTVLRADVIAARIVAYAVAVLHTYRVFAEDPDHVGMVDALAKEDAAYRAILTAIGFGASAEKPKEG